MFNIVPLYSVVRDTFILLCCSEGFSYRCRCCKMLNALCFSHSWHCNYLLQSLNNLTPGSPIALNKKNFDQCDFVGFQLIMYLFILDIQFYFIVGLMIVSSSMRCFFLIVRLNHYQLITTIFLALHLRNQVLYVLADYIDYLLLHFIVKRHVFHFGCSFLSRGKR